MKKRMCLVLACVFVLMFAVSACNSNNGSQPAADSPQPAANSPQPAADSPQPAANSPQPAANSPQPAANSPQPAATTPESWDNEKKITITYQSQYTPAHYRGALEQWWIDLVAEKTGGTVIIEPYWSSSLFSAATGFYEVLAGTADATQISPGTATDHFVLEPAVNLFVSAQRLTFKQASLLSEELYNNTPELQAEWEGLIPINWDQSGEGYWISSIIPIRSMADLNGKSIRCTSEYWTDALIKLGASPLRMPSGEVLDSMSKGILHGGVSGLASMTDNSWVEVCNYSTSTKMLSTVGLQRFMRADKYNEMSPRQQEAFMESIDELREEIWRVSKEKEGEVIQYCLDNGVELIEWTDEQYQELYQLFFDLCQEKVEELNAAGYPGTEIYQRVLDLVEKYKNT